MGAEVVEDGRSAPMATADRRSARPFDAEHALRLGGLGAVLVLAWALGLSGAFASIRGWGDLVVFAPVQRAGQLRLALVAAGWLAVATAVGPRPFVRLATWVGALVLALELAAPNVGRVPAMVALGSTLVAHAALVAPARPGRWPHRPRAVAWPALVPLLAAQVLWVLGAGRALTIAALVLALVVVDAHHRFPAATDAVHRPADRLVGRLRTGAGTVAAQVAAGRAPAGRAVAAAPAWLWDRRNELGAAAVSVVLLAPSLHRYASQPPSVLGSSDYETHIAFARLTPLWPPIPATPHFLFHLSVSALSGLVGTTLAATLVPLTAVALLGVVLVRWARRPFAGRPGLGPSWGWALAVGYVVLESPSVIAAALHVGSRYDWAPTDHMLLSPTDTLLVPFAIALVVLVADAIAGRTVLDGRAARWLATTTVLAAVAKPSMNLVLLVAVPAYLLLTRRLDRPLVGHLARWFVVPSVLVVIGQTWLIEAGTDDLPRAGLALRPFDTVRQVHLDRSGPLLLAAFLVVPLCLWASGRRYLREPTVALALLATVVGVAIMLLVNETGELRADGVFTKPAFMCAVVLHLVSWRFLLGEASARPPGRPPAWLLATMAFAGLCAVAGVLALLSSSGWLHLPIRSGSY